MCALPQSCRRPLTRQPATHPLRLATVSLSQSLKHATNLEHHRLAADRMCTGDTRRPTTICSGPVPQSRARWRPCRAPLSPAGARLGPGVDAHQATLLFLPELHPEVLRTSHTREITGCYSGRFGQDSSLLGRKCPRAQTGTARQPCRNGRVRLPSTVTTPPNPHGHRATVDAGGISHPVQTDHQEHPAFLHGRSGESEPEGCRRSMQTL